jgi:hypothetical protein
MSCSYARRLGTALLLLLPPLLAGAEEFEGVQPAALDQPRINLAIRRAPSAPPLSGKAITGDETFNIEAFLDTGASGIVIAAHSAEQLGIKRELVKAGGGEVRFEDVGVGGGSKFAVSEPLLFSMAAYTPNAFVDNANAINGVYSQTAGPLRAQIGPLDTGADLLTALALGDLDVVGTPALQGRVVVMDVKPVNTFADKIRTYVYDARDKHPAAPGIPQVKRHVKLSYASFQRFTKVEPASASAPAIAANPFIGPDPLRPAGDQTPPIIVTHHGKTTSGSWLLDTGAAASMMSRKQAAALGIQYAANTFGTDHPKLDGVPAAQQFTLTVGGIGGSRKAAGIYLDKLTLRTREGQPLTYVKAPVLINDITVKDAAGQELTLDGVFGMNFLVASAKLTEGLLPDIDNLTPGPFRWVVFDQPAGMLGLGD